MDALHCECLFQTRTRCARVPTPSPGAGHACLRTLRARGYRARKGDDALESGPSGSLLAGVAR